MKKLRITASQQTSDTIYIDFQFLGLPTIINSNYILGTNLDETTFDDFIEPIDKAIKKANTSWRTNHELNRKLECMPDRRWWGI